MKAHRLLALDRGDLPRLAALAPSFAVTAAAVVILASLSKALFLAENPVSLLPWMFLGSAALTALGAVAYAAAVERLSLGRRAATVLALALASLLVLRGVFPVEPRIVGIVVLLWCPAVSQLLLTQTWGVVGELLPTRQGKRLFPVLAATSTAGATAGGLAVQLLLAWLPAEDLLIAAALLLVWPLFGVRTAIRVLGAAGRGERDEDQRGAARANERAETTPSLARALWREPLLRNVAAFMFLSQAASLVIDYQLSAALKPHFDKEGIAGFLGTFYWTSNLLVLALTLLVTARFVRAVGIGLALAASSIAVGAGSAIYLAGAWSRATTLFWIVAATAFAERVTSFAFSRPALQMVFMPLQGRGSERAKPIIEGVVQRLGIAAVSALLLLAPPDLASHWRLSAPTVLACGVVVYLAVRLGPHYRQAIFAALAAHRLDPAVASYLRDGIERGAAADLAARLRSADPGVVRSAIEVARELGVELTRGQLLELARHADDAVAECALAAMTTTGVRPSRADLERLLDPKRPPRLLRVLLASLAKRPDPDVAEVVRPLTRHPDAAVASAACVLRAHAAGDSALAALDAEIAAAPERNTDEALRRLTGMTRAGNFARDLGGLLDDPAPEVRREAVELMAQLALPSFAAPLIGCLGRPDMRRAAVAALVRLGEGTVASLRTNLADPDLGLPARVALIEVLEGLARPVAVGLLLEQCHARETALRQHAAGALWRLGGAERAGRPAREAVLGAAHLELARLRRYAAAERHALGKLRARRLFFIDELRTLAEQTEARTFRYLGLLYDRAAIQRAEHHYRSSLPRERSNALELLDQHVRDAELRPFVRLVERAEDAGGALRAPSAVLQGAGGTVEEALGDDEPWLRRLWAWVCEHERADGPPDWDDPLDRLVILKAGPLLRAISGEQLLQTAEAGSRIALAEGAPLFEEGASADEVYLLLEGRIALTKRAVRVATIGAHECVGELELFDGARRACAAHAERKSVLVHVARDRFRDLLDLSPALALGLTIALAGRLRAAVAAADAAAHRGEIAS